MWIWSTATVQTVIFSIQTIVFTLQTVVLTKTLSTVKKQAIAADAQANASENQADMAIQQTYANIAKADQTMRPLITLEPNEPLPGQERILDDFNGQRKLDQLALRLRNDGLGPAFEIRAFLEERTVDAHTFARVDLLLTEDSLGTDKEMTTSLVRSELVFQNLVVEYR